MQNCGKPHNRPRKRRHTDNDCERPGKLQRLWQPPAISTKVGDLTQQKALLERQHQLPSPSLTKSHGDHTKPSQAGSSTRKRKARSLDSIEKPPSTKRTLPCTEFPKPNPSIVQWLSTLPEDKRFDDLESMSLPPPKRSRSSDSLSRILSQSRDGTDSTVSRDRKYSAYRDINYPVVLETKGSFMRQSEAGLVDDDAILCAKLFSTSQPRPKSSLLHECFEKFHALLQGRSESRIYLDLHPIVVPSAENRYIEGRKEFQGLVEGHNDIWAKAIPFYGPRPQPDHTFGFKWSNFTDLQRKKLGIDPNQKSYYTAREDIYFPFLTSEVKCGKQGLDLADRPNAHSMTIALRGLVDLFRRANRAGDLHRRALGFSISHDDRSARIFAHYPEIDGENTTFWRKTIKEINIGEQPWISYQFTLNACQIFAPDLLNRLKAAIDQIPDPVAQSFEPVGVDELAVVSSQDDSSAPDSQDEGSRKSRKPGGLHAELRTMIQSLQRQLEQHRRDAEQQRRDADQQRRESEQHSKDLLTQLGRQREDSERQREDSERQRNELMQILKQQSEQIRELTRKS